ncbi:hypothetical protein HOY34_02410 [Xinfangfangia sp. D13-10-4-6]|uniref:hypothetical protein n=1 Tax=Pseudogemmobacter hezensis TaxID=2737662 RepID=UPI0015566F86|nr:hypothetical protein [Pseudogemmobacter hezensis]NPD14050.1 hypothetical protein [Pseudogemmobacter hezensis]
MRKSRFTAPQIMAKTAASADSVRRNDLKPLCRNSPIQSRATQSKPLSAGQLSLFVAATPTSDDSGAAAVLHSVSKADWMPADGGQNTDWFKGALNDSGIDACPLNRKVHKMQFDTKNAATKI